MNVMPLFRSTTLLIFLIFSGVTWAGEVNWIDVRTQEEFSQNHVPDAVNIPYDQIGERLTALGLEKDQVIYLYCGSGRRAGIAKETLETLGYTQVVNIGGLDDALAKSEKSGQE